MGEEENAMAQGFPVFKSGICYSSERVKPVHQEMPATEDRLLFILHEEGTTQGRTRVCRQAEGEGETCTRAFIVVSASRNRPGRVSELSTGWLE